MKGRYNKMTFEILNMTKEELIEAIEETDKRGRELEEETKEMVDLYNNLVKQAESIKADIEQGTRLMQLLALTQASMRQELAEKFETFVM